MAAWCSAALLSAGGKDLGFWHLDKRIQQLLVCLRPLRQCCVAALFRGQRKLWFGWGSPPVCPGSARPTTTNTADPPAPCCSASRLHCSIRSTNIGGGTQRRWGHPSWHVSIPRSALLLNPMKMSDWLPWFHWKNAWDSVLGICTSAPGRMHSFTAEWLGRRDRVWQEWLYMFTSFILAFLRIRLWHLGIWGGQEHPDAWSWWMMWAGFLWGLWWRRGHWPETATKPNSGDKRIFFFLIIFSSKMTATQERERERELLKWKHSFSMITQRLRWSALFRGDLKKQLFASWVWRDCWADGVGRGLYPLNAFLLSSSQEKKFSTGWVRSLR